jgi:serpin B
MSSTIRRLVILLVFIQITACSAAYSADLAPASEATAQSAAGGLFPQASTDFGLNLLRELVDKPKNVFICPLSVHTALDMVVTGADGSTAEEMARTLAVNKDWSAVEPSFKNYLNALKSAPSKAVLARGASASLKLELANSFWGRQDMKFQPDFVQRLKNTFNASCEAVDFKNPETIKRVNSWVKAKTQGKIDSIIKKFPDRCTSVLANAAYFKGAWDQQFKKYLTRPQNFRLTETGSPVQVPMMHGDGRYPYYEDSEVQSVALPYTDSRFCMFVVLPKPGITLNQFRGLLTGEKWRKWTAVESQKVNLSLPKFKINYEVKLKPILEKLGMSSAFSDLANFNKMIIPTPEVEGVKIDEVVHKTFVDVNEEGTEAAAVTAVMMAEVASAGPEPKEMVVDRPFFCAVAYHNEEKNDKPFHSIIFAGLVTDPR